MCCENNCVVDYVMNFINVHLYMLIFHLIVLVVLVLLSTNYVGTGTCRRNCVPLFGMGTCTNGVDGVAKEVVEESTLLLCRVSLLLPEDPTGT